MSELVVTDLERSFSPRPTTYSMEAVRAAVSQIETTNVRRLAQTLTGLPAQASPLDLDVLRTRLAVTKAAQTLKDDPHVPPYVVEADDMISLLGGPSRLDDLRSWFSLAPDYAGGSKVALALGPDASASERTATASWANGLSPSERTDLLLGFSSLADDVSAWVESLASEPVDEQRFLDDLDRRLRGASRGDVRTDLARTMAALRPTAAAAQRTIGRLVLWLLEQDKKVDFDAALILLPALGENHRMGRELGDAFNGAANRGYKIPNRAIDDLKRAKVALRKRGLPEELWRRFRGR